jgi:uncharacterized membrane protein YciS (DUF1049 family)
MKTNIRSYMIIVAVISALFMLSVAAPAIADQVATFTGKITKGGFFMTDKGTTYLLIGDKAAQLTNGVGKKVEIKGMQREKNELNLQYMGPTLEVYSYKWLGKSEKK